MPKGPNPFAAKEITPQQTHESSSKRKTVHFSVQYLISAIVITVSRKQSIKKALDLKIGTLDLCLVPIDNHGFTHPNNFPNFKLNCAAGEGVFINAQQLEKPSFQSYIPQQKKQA